MSSENKTGGRLNLGILYPLAGVLIAYILLLLSVYIELVTNAQRQPQDGMYYGSVPYLHAYTYLMLLAIAVLLVSSLIGRRITGGKHAGDPGLRLNRNAYTFTTITVIGSLIAAVIYALVIFLSNLGVGAAEVKNDPLLRLVSLYIPILLDAALLVFGILRAFVLKPKGASK